MLMPERSKPVPCVSLGLNKPSVVPARKVVGGEVSLGRILTQWYLPSQQTLLNCFLQPFKMNAFIITKVVLEEDGQGVLNTYLCGCV